MRTVLAIAASCALLISACGGEQDDSGNDRAEIEATVHAYFDALAAGNVEKLVGYLTSECEVDLEAVKEEYRAEFGGGELEANIEKVEILRLEGGTADVRVTGTISAGELDVPINPTGESITPMVEEDGEWRFSSCNLGGSG